MIKNIEGVTLFTASAKKLAAFYSQTLGLTIAMEAEMGDKGEMAYELKLKKGSNFYIVDHSEIKGKAKEPKRVIINFEVSDIEKEVNRLKKTKAKLVQDIYHVQEYGQIATFEDIDGNYFQLVQIRPS